MSVINALIDHVVARHPTVRSEPRIAPKAS